MKSLVIIPTYNERENIEQLVPVLFRDNSNLHVLVVDDNSPDGTAKTVVELQEKFKNLHLLNRERKSGLGKAYLAGFKWALERNFDLIVEMDADFSHRPEDLIRLIEAAKRSDVDFVIGSRYVSGGGTLNWGAGRKLISRGGGFYSRMILGYPIRDWTGGFNGWKKEVLQSIGLENITSEGYSFQIELKYRALKKNFKYVEVPILFEDRRIGQSKMSSRIVVEALFRVWRIRLEV